MNEVNLNDLIKMMKKNVLLKNEALYLIHLYNLSKNEITLSDASINKKDILNMFRNLNASLRNSNNTNEVVNRLKAVNLLFEKYYEIVNDLNEINDIYYQIGFLSYISNVNINSLDAKKILINKLSKYKEEENENTNAKIRY